MQQQLPIIPVVVRDLTHPPCSPFRPHFSLHYHSQVSSINDVLRQYEQYGGVSFHWRTIGSSGHDRRPHSPVVDAYISCLAPRHPVRAPPLNGRGGNCNGGGWGMSPPHYTGWRPHSPVVDAYISCLAPRHQVHSARGG